MGIKFIPMVVSFSEMTCQRYRNPPGKGLGTCHTIGSNVEGGCSGVCIGNGNFLLSRYFPGNQKDKDCYHCKRQFKNFTIRRNTIDANEDNIVKVAGGDAPAV